MVDPVSATRHWRSRTELARFTDSVRDWYELRVASDHAHQYASQLEAVRSELLTAAQRIEAQLGNQPGSVLDTYANCARCDLAVGWLHRVFTFFREKFDQRDDPRFSSALRAADEVVWSCFRAFTRHDHPKEPAPLPYIEAQYSPASVRRDRSLAGVVTRGGGFDFLAEYLRTLPIPVLRLPMTAVHTPWVHVVIGHEVGHFVQPLVTNGYVDQFAGLVHGVAAQTGATPMEAGAWRECAVEIFADWYSVAAMGPWALWAIAQFELASEKTMRERRAEFGYPSALVRLRFLQHLADALSPEGKQLGTAALTALGDPTLVSAQPVTAGEKNDHAIAAALATRLAAEEIGPRGSLTKTVGYDGTAYAEKGEVELWSRTLVGELGRAPKRKLEEARHIAAASARTVALRTFDDDAARATFMTSLTDATFQKIRDSAVEGTRGAKGAVQFEANGEALAALLLGLDVPDPAVAP